MPKVLSIRNYRFHAADKILKYSHLRIFFIKGIYEKIGKSNNYLGAEATDPTDDAGAVAGTVGGAAAAGLGAACVGGGEAGRVDIWLKIDKRYCNIFVTL